MSYSKQIKTIVKLAEDVLGINTSKEEEFISVAISPMSDDHGFQVWIERSGASEDKTGPYMKLAVHNGVQLLEEHKNLDDALKALLMSLSNIREQTHPTYITVRGVQYVRTT